MIIPKSIEQINQEHEDRINNPDIINKHLYQCIKCKNEFNHYDFISEYEMCDKCVYKLIDKGEIVESLGFSEQEKEDFYKWAKQTKGVSNAKK